MVQCAEAVGYENRTHRPEAPWGPGVVYALMRDVVALEVVRRFHEAEGAVNVRAWPKVYGPESVILIHGRKSETKEPWSEVNSALIACVGGRHRGFLASVTST
jgi:hypothetical protein